MYFTRVFDKPGGGKKKNSYHLYSLYIWIFSSKVHHGNHRLRQITQYLPKFLNLVPEIPQADKKDDKGYVCKNQEYLVDLGAVNRLEQWVF